MAFFFSSLLIVLKESDSNAKEKGNIVRLMFPKKKPKREKRKSVQMLQSTLCVCLCIFLVCLFRLFVNWTRTSNGLASSICVEILSRRDDIRYYGIDTFLFWGGAQTRKRRNKCIRQDHVRMWKARV